MSNTRIFRTILLTAVMFNILAAVALVVVGPQTAQQAHPTLFAGLFALVINVCYVASIIGLFLFKPFARPLFVIYLTLGVVHDLLIEPSAGSAVMNASETIACLLLGAVCGLIYFSPIRDKFMKLSA